MENLVVDCPTCEANSRCDILGTHVEFDDFFEHYFRLALVKCPACNSAVLVRQGDRNPPDAPDYSWGPPRRVWPSSERTLSPHIPEDVRKNVEEAQKCLRVGAYNACAVMCGRALEAVAHAFGTKKRVLAGGLQDLRDARVIDQRLYEWGDVLRTQRNLAAHASSADITKTDATDLVEFTNAICEYVFVLTARFQKFMERKDSPTPSTPPPSRRGKVDSSAPEEPEGDDIPF